MGEVWRRRPLSQPKLLRTPFLANFRIVDYPSGMAFRADTVSALPSLMVAEAAGTGAKGLTKVTSTAPRLGCPSRMRVIATLVCLAASAWAQEAAKVCSDGRTINIASQWDQLGLTMPASEVAAQPLQYSISSPQGVQGAWIEVWDRPKRLSRKAVSVKREGEAGCAGCGDAGQTPEELHISIFDPEVPLYCIDFCSGAPGNGEYVSEVLVGKQPVEDSDESVEPAYLMDYPVLTGAPIRIVEGIGSTSVVLSGENLIPSSRVYLVTGEDASPTSRASRDYLYSRTLDLRHVEVTMPSDLLDKPGVLTAYAKDSWEGKESKGSGTGQKMIVASKNSPVINSVKPKVLRYRGLDATVVLRGSGFTEQSEVKFEDDVRPEVPFVSSSELRIGIPAAELAGDSSLRFAKATPVKLSVTNDPLHFSAPVTVHVLPSAKFKPQPLTAVLRAVAPYPVPMMDFQSPELLTLEIGGDNFRPNDIVFFSNGQSDRSRLKTQYVSSHHLRAWLPRESWRKHRLSFRLVVQTSAGFCAAEAFAESLE